MILIGGELLNCNKATVRVILNNAVKLFLQIKCDLCHGIAKQQLLT